MSIQSPPASIGTGPNGPGKVSSRAGHVAEATVVDGRIHATLRDDLTNEILWVEVAEVAPDEEVEPQLARTALLSWWGWQDEHELVPYLADSCRYSLTDSCMGAFCGDAWGGNWDCADHYFGACKDSATYVCSM